MSIIESSTIIDGAELCYLEAGEGAPLLLIHGLGGPLMWQKVIEPLSKSFRVIVIDLPGFGNSDVNKKWYTPEEHASICRSLLSSLNITKAHIVGISYGGQIAVHLTTQYPDVVDKLVLCCSAGLLPAPPMISSPVLWQVTKFIGKHIIHRSKRLTCRMGQRSFHNIIARPPDLCEQVFNQLQLPGHSDAWLNGLYNSMTGNEPFRIMLPTIQSEALLLWGEQDKTVPIIYADGFRKLIPNNTFVMFPNCGHSVPLEKPEEFGDEVVGFCQVSNSI